MSKADKMFLKLGYEIEEDDYEEDWILISYYNPAEDETITFWHNKTFRKSIDNTDCADITMEEFKAITKKIKELGWR